MSHATFIFYSSSFCSSLLLLSVKLFLTVTVLLQGSHTGLTAGTGGMNGFTRSNEFLSPGRLSEGDGNAVKRYNFLILQLHYRASL